MIRSILACLALALFLGGCRPVLDPVFNGIDNLRVNKLAWGESSVTLDMNFSNPNPFRARLTAAEGEAWMDSTYLGHFRIDTTVDIPAATDFIVPVNLSVNMKQLLQHSLNAYFNKEVLIRIEGKGRAGRSGVHRNFNLRYQGMQDLSKIFR